MKYILLIICILISPSLLRAQSVVYYYPVNTPGIEWQRGAFDTTLHIPFHDTLLYRGLVRPGSIVLGSADTTLYTWAGNHYKQVSPRGGFGTVTTNGILNVDTTKISNFRNNVIYNNNVALFNYDGNGNRGVGNTAPLGYAVEGTNNSFVIPGNLQVAGGMVDYGDSAAATKRRTTMDASGVWTDNLAGDGGSGTNFRKFRFGSSGKSILFNAIADGGYIFTATAAGRLYLGAQGIGSLDSVNSVGLSVGAGYANVNKKLLANNILVIDASNNIFGTTVNVYATANLTAQSGAVATVATYTPTATGTYRIGAYVDITAVATDILKTTVTFTDTHSTVTSIDFFPQGLTSASLATTGFYAYPTLEIRAGTGSAIVVKTTLVVGGGTITYDVGATITKIN